MKKMLSLALLLCGSLSISALQAQPSTIMVLQNSSNCSVTYQLTWYCPTWPNTCTGTFTASAAITLAAGTSTSVLEPCSNPNGAVYSANVTYAGGSTVTLYFLSAGCPGIGGTNSGATAAIDCSGNQTTVQQDNLGLPHMHQRIIAN